MTSANVSTQIFVTFTPQSYDPDIGGQVPALLFRSCTNPLGQKNALVGRTRAIHFVLLIGVYYVIVYSPLCTVGRLGNCYANFTGMGRLANQAFK